MADGKGLVIFLLLLLLIFVIVWHVVTCYASNQTGGDMKTQTVTGERLMSVLAKNLKIGENQTLLWVDEDNLRTVSSMLTKVEAGVWLLVTDVGVGSAGQTLELPTAQVAQLLNGVSGYTSTKVDKTRYIVAGDGSLSSVTQKPPRQ